MRCSVHSICLLLLCSALFLSNCGKKNGNNDKKEKDETLVPVETAQVIQGEISAYFSGTAPLEAEEETEVVAKVGGVVDQIFIEEGDWVKKDQILAKLDDEKLKVQVEQAKAALMKLKNEYNRGLELYDKQLISVEDFQKKKYDYEAQEAAFEMAQLDLNYTSIRSPISGVVSERKIKVGNMVITNQAVFRVTDMDPLHAVLYVPEKQSGMLKVGQPAKLRVDALADQIFAGHILRISPVVDPSTGTVKVTVEVNDTDHILKAGMFARVQIIYDVHPEAILIPKDALISEDKYASVFVVQDSMSFKRDVTVGFINTSHIEILSGVMPGDTVITTGKGSLRDSTRVEPVESGK